MKIIDETELAAFLEMVMVYDVSKDHKVVVFCEECNNMTTVSTKTGVECGHRPNWLDGLERFLDGQSKHAQA